MRSFFVLSLVVSAAVAFPMVRDPEAPQAEGQMKPEQLQQLSSLVASARSAAANSDEVDVRNKVMSMVQKAINGQKSNATQIVMVIFSE